MSAACCVPSGVVLHRRVWRRREQLARYRAEDVLGLIVERSVRDGGPASPVDHLWRARRRFQQIASHAREQWTGVPS